MSEQNETSQAQEAKPNILDKLVNAGIDFETIIPLLSNLEELIISINEIPAQIELLSRATLAAKFVQFDGKTYTFNRSAFEPVWDAVAGNETEQKPGESE